MKTEHTQLLQTLEQQIHRARDASPGKTILTLMTFPLFCDVHLALSAAGPLGKAPEVLYGSILDVMHPSQCTGDAKMSMSVPAPDVCEDLDILEFKQRFAHQVARAFPLKFVG